MASLGMQCTDGGVVQKGQDGDRTGVRAIYLFSSVSQDSRNERVVGGALTTDLVWEMFFGRRPG